MKIPDEKDWKGLDPDCLDAQYAHKQFFGKSAGEALELFKKNAFHYQEDLSSMPKVPFDFYSRVFVDYLLSEDAKEDADAASCFLSMVKWNFAERREEVMTADLEQLFLETAEQISKKQEFYDADPEIYGLFSEKLKKIKRLMLSK